LTRIAREFLQFVSCFAPFGPINHIVSVDKLFDVLYEDDGLLIVNKPAGLVCHPTKADVYSSLISRARLYLGEASRPHLINRLDRETSGVTIIAKNQLTAGRLGKLWEGREVSKQYLAIVHGHVTEPQGSIDAPLGKDEASKVAIKDCVRPDGSPARTDYKVSSRFVRLQNVADLLRDQGISPGSLESFSLLRVVPQTGRKHQIRIHLAHLGHPIVGDKLYGGDEELYLAFVDGRLNDQQHQRLILPCHALHAQQVSFHWQGQVRDFTAPAEPWFTSFAQS
jgi:23S rRNA pseudouridine1911/1915/1917 synthase